MSRTPKVEAERIRRWLEWHRRLVEAVRFRDLVAWDVPDVLQAILDGEEPPE